MAMIDAVDERLSSLSPAAAPPIVLKSSEFRKGREEGWRELETLVLRFERRGVRGLSLDELQRLPILYRAALSSLSVARTIALDRNLLLYLENLALRAFLVVYGPRISPIEGLRDFFRRDLPAAVRSARWHAALAALALLIGIAAGFMLVLQDEGWLTSIIPSSLSGGRGPSSTRADLLTHELFPPWPGATATFGYFANVLFNHNTLVGIFSFGLGLAAGVPTALLLIYNGLVLGALLALHYNRDLTVDFLGWVSIHGAAEIGAFILFGAGGRGDRRENAVPGPVHAHRKSGAAWPPGGADGGRRRAHAVRRGNPGRRLPASWCKARRCV